LQEVETGIFDHCSLRPLYVVNIDVEGVEAKVLRGMQQTIAACHPMFLIENSDWHAVYGLLGGALVSLLFYMLVAMRSGI